AADNGDVESAAASVATNYEININDVEIYELKNGGVHVAYGPMLAYGLLENSRAVTNDVKDCALFIGDTRYGDIGFFLTDESMDGVSTFNFIAENTPNDNIVDPNAPQQPEQTTPDTPTVTPPASRPNYDTSEEIVWQSGAKEESKANPATGDGFNTAVSAVMALSVLAGAAVVLGKKK
ncbi:MAG: NPXTG-anchored protein, partial [Oscillospiraceae bacterium]|nr:NPXTG-anchored protein [Oscillospiraceae bacterium]